MRRSVTLIVVAVGALLISSSALHAEGQVSVIKRTTSNSKSAAKTAASSGKKANTSTTKQQATTKAQSGKPTVTRENLGASTEQKQRAATLQRTATVEEQRVASQLKTLQILMAKEEQALAQRMAYAAKLRAQGLAKNDESILRKAEQIERQALQYYEQRVKQFEQFTIKASQSQSRPQQSTRGSSSRSSSRSRTRR